MQAAVSSVANILGLLCDKRTIRDRFLLVNHCKQNRTNSPLQMICITHIYLNIFFVFLFFLSVVRMLLCYFFAVHLLPLLFSIFVFTAFPIFFFLCGCERESVAEKVAPYKQNKGGVRFLDAILKNTTGKILRRKLKLKYVRKQ